MSLTGCLPQKLDAYLLCSWHPLTLQWHAILLIINSLTSFVSHNFTVLHLQCHHHHSLSVFVKMSYFCASVSSGHHITPWTDLFSTSVTGKVSSHKPTYLFIFRKCLKNSLCLQRCKLVNQKTHACHHTFLVFAAQHGGSTQRVSTMLLAMLHFFGIFTVRCSYASAVLGVVILSACLSHACFVTNPKNLPAIFLYLMKGQSF